MMKTDEPRLVVQKTDANPSAESEFGTRSSALEGGRWVCQL